MTYLFRTGLVLLVLVVQAWAAAPTVSNVTARQLPGSKCVDISYDVASSETNLVTVSVVVSNASGLVKAAHFSGAIGPGIATGTGRKIRWDGGADYNGLRLSGLRVCVIASADGGSDVPEQPEMVLIPAGAFDMGSSVAIPIHPVELSAFYMDRTEVTKGAWDAVAVWALANGFGLCNAAGKAMGHPAQHMDWHSAVKWCNARSVREGLTPCYTNADGTVYKEGVFAGGCDWAANGYRLPTEAEWEYAARGTGTNNRFPWTDSNEIQHTRANYWSCASTPYDTSLTRGYHPAYNDGVLPYTSPVGSFPANAYGLCDMAGNVAEWCWDIYRAPYLTAPTLDPRGAPTGSHRVVRGGNWGGTSTYAAYICDVAYRNINSADGAADTIGFRCVRAAAADRAMSAFKALDDTFQAGILSDVEPNASDPFNADFRDYTLTVISACGASAPPVGSQSYAWHATVTGTVPSVVSAGGTNWTCAGWVGTGSVPSSGSAVTTGPVVLTNQTSSLTWLWTVSAVKPSISVQPQSRTNRCASASLFSVVASGIPSVAYQWRCNGVNLDNGARISGAKSDTLSIANTQLSDAGNYSVVVANAMGSVTSQVAVLTMAAGDDAEEAPAVSFASETHVTSGEGVSGVGTFNAVVPVSGVGPASATVYVVPGSAALSDYVAPKKPISLSWAAGEAGTKWVTIPIKGDRMVEGNEVFYLALGAPGEGAIGEPRVCAVTIKDDDAGTAPSKGVFVAGLPQPPEGGKVSGGAYCLPGRTVTLTARANPGWTFLCWEDDSQSASRAVRGEQAAAVEQNGTMLCSALFKRTVDLALPVLANPGPQSAMIGVAFNLPLEVESECLPRAKVFGLPAGLKYDASKQRIVGVPTRPGTFNVTVALSNPKGAATPQSFTIMVFALPAWAQGTFNGVADTDVPGSGGIASMSVTPLGRVSGKLSLMGTNYSFSASSYAACDEEGVFWLTATAKVARVSLPLTLAVYRPVLPGLTVAAPETLGKSNGTFGDKGWITLYRNVWKDPDMVAVINSTFMGYYTAVLSGEGEDATGYLNFAVDKAGSVKTAGKLPNGSAVSLGGTLLMDEAGRVFTVLCASPKSLQGGRLFGTAEFMTPGSSPTEVRLLDEPFSWMSLNPVSD